ncbi:hypothetical protein [Pseudomonas sp. Gutcm_11s]|uniref:hypothetical protein n=1 Tax=Pseudomonas sp. Gutcm_11s TaxID=3026088 RepID=UPI0023611EB3|nr:hypothetical protein [Pseudomonas sp. Gutcm_11s]MDD0841430.1 hypothetical protein [Pseudomonas sp. Gutcm_11s]
MNTHSRVTMLASGLALATLAVTTLTAALDLSFRELDAARQQAKGWEAYALSLHRRDLLTSRDDGMDETGPSYGLLTNRLETAVEHPQRPGFRF